jgi:hypothetical protein
MSNEATAPAVSTTTKAPEVPIPACNIAVERNSIKLPFVNWKILKGERANGFYPAPKVTVENLNEVCNWIGESILVNELQTILKRRFQNIFVDALNGDGQLDEALFMKYAVDYSVSGMKLKEINDKLDELQAQLTKLIDAGEWMTNDVVKQELSGLNDQIRAYRQMREDRQRKPKQEEEIAPSVVA